MFPAWPEGDRIRRRFVCLYVGTRGYLSGRDVIGSSTRIRTNVEIVVGRTAEGRVADSGWPAPFPPLFITIDIPQCVLGVQAPLSLSRWRICAIGQRELARPLDTLGAFSAVRCSWASPQGKGTMFEARPSSLHWHRRAANFVSDKPGVGIWRWVWRWVSDVLINSPGRAARADSGLVTSR